MNALYYTGAQQGRRGQPGGSRGRRLEARGRREGGGLDAPCLPGLGGAAEEGGELQYFQFQFEVSPNQRFTLSLAGTEAAHGRPEEGRGGGATGDGRGRRQRQAERALHALRRHADEHHRAGRAQRRGRGAQPGKNAFITAPVSVILG